LCQYPILLKLNLKAYISPLTPFVFKIKLQQELAAIFKKIGEKQTCTIGLYELYRITQLYPKVRIKGSKDNRNNDLFFWFRVNVQPIRFLLI